MGRVLLERPHFTDISSANRGGKSLGSLLTRAVNSHVVAHGTDFSTQCWVLLFGTFLFAAIMTFEGLELYAISRSVVAAGEVLAITRTIQVLDGFAPLSAAKHVSSRPPKIFGPIPESQRHHVLSAAASRNTSPSLPAHATSTGELVPSASLPDINLDTNQIRAVLPWGSNPTPPVFTPAYTRSSKQINSTQHGQPSEPERERDARLKSGLQARAPRDLPYPQPIRQAEESLLPERPSSTNPYTYVAPWPLKEVMPNSKAYGVLVIRAPVEIEVHVKINEKGGVIDAFVSTSQNSAARSPLTFAAIAAARQWIFEPARMHEKKIPSDYSIRFNFRPNVQ